MEFEKRLEEFMNNRMVEMAQEKVVPLSLMQKDFPTGDSKTMIQMRNGKIKAK